jgi:hypothetical protein
MADDDFTWIEISENEMERLVQAERDMRASADELFTRFALPDEREQIGRRIDPTTAHVFFVYAQTGDPYGDYPDPPEEEQQVGREYFAVDPTGGIAVAWHHLPKETREALNDKYRRACREGWRRVFDLIRNDSP